MLKRYLQFQFLFFIIAFLSWKSIGNNWIAEKHVDYNLFYTSIDNKNKDEYSKFVEKGIISVKKFFGNSFNKTFDVIVHPNRHSLDSTWQKDWKMPDFRSECWMVASGVSTKLDIISPKKWDKEACEHIYTNFIKTQQLITHELVHVYHGQINISPDFSNVEGIDWFVEGLATYASGQCDSERISEIKKAIISNNIPKSLDSFWTGNLKYGLSGSVVMYIDHKYGRAQLKKLLPFNKKSEILSSLNTSEDALLKGWKDFMMNKN